MSLPTARRFAPATFCLTVALALTGCDVDDDDGVRASDLGGDSVIRKLIVPIAPDQVTSPVDAPGAGGDATLTIDRIRSTINGYVEPSSLSGPANAAHIHLGPAGTTGELLLTLIEDDKGDFLIPDDSALDAVQLDAVLSGGAYIDVHTDAHPDGEVRGQIITEGIGFTVVELSGENEVPPVATDASAIGIATLNEASGTLSATVRTAGLDDAIGAHIHSGVAGDNGPVLIALVQDPSDPSVWRTGADALLGPAGRAAFADGGLYFNVHTPDNEAGEVRGQL